MSHQVLIAQSDQKLVQPLMKLFTELGKQVVPVATPAAATSLLADNPPELLVFDLHLPNNGWHDMLAALQQESPHTKILFSSNYPEPKLEAQVRDRFGAQTFLRQPFTRANLEQTLRTLDKVGPPEKASSRRADLPKVRVPVRIKITLPYVLLALLLAIAAAYVVSRLVLDTIEERFTNQLIEVGKMANDWMVQEEDRLLETLRLVAHTREIPEAVAAGDAEQLRELALPIAINYREDAVEILDTQGVSLLSLRHNSNGNIEDYDASRGDTIYTQWDFVSNVLDQQTEQGRDKYAGLAQTPWGDYIYVAGPISDDEGNQVGVILVGKSLSTLVTQIRQNTLAHTTVYDLNGRPLASTFLLLDENSQALEIDTLTEVLQRQDEESLMRPISVASINYSEIVGPWEVREFLGRLDVTKSNNDLGLIGVSLAETFLARPSQITRLQIFVLTAVTFTLVIVLGILLARRITRPLLQVVEASAQVAEGNLDVQVKASGNDEVAVLAHSFNQMVSGLQEGSLYRDILGRTVSPEVREELRRSFASGDVRLEGQDAVATVLMSDIRGFTTLSEAEDSTTIMTWLNEYFNELVPVITSHGGVISKFEGDSVLAFFGILPRPLSPQESAYQACQAALAMIEATERLNERRIKRSEPPFIAGVGINTGPVTAGGLGSADRLHYTIIGDTVNTTARLEGLTRQFGENSAVISQHTLFALRDWRYNFELESMGVFNVKGKEEQLLVYRLCPLDKETASPKSESVETA